MSTKGSRVEDKASLLVVVLDTNPVFWTERSQSSRGTLIKYESMLEQLFLFLNNFLMFHTENRLAFISNHPTDTKFLFPTGVSAESDSQVNFLSQVGMMREQLKSIVPMDSLTSQKSQFSAALSLALCYINRIKKAESIVGKLDCRILVIQGTSDSPAQYIPMMNCIFSAQKINILVDACVLGLTDSTFLQQATDLTGGLYLRLPEESQHVFLQYLLTVYLPDQAARGYLIIPTQTQVDFRASCFCHRNTIDTGYVCSVCLSIFCSALPRCTTCHTKFDLPRIKKESRSKRNGTKSR